MDFQFFSPIQFNNKFNKKFWDKIQFNKMFNEKNPIQEIIQFKKSQFKKLFNLKKLKNIQFKI